MDRIVCLTPSAVDIVCALGLEESLAACPREARSPGLNGDLPSCTAPVLPADGFGAEGRLRLLSEVAWHVDWELVEALAPTHIIAQGDWRAARAVERIPAGLRERLVLSPPCATLTDVWRGVLDLAAALDRRDLGVDLVVSYQTRMAAIVNQAIGIVARPRVAVLEWIEPPLAAGGYIPELVELAGGKYLLRRPGEDAAAIGLDALIAEAPEVVLVAGCNLTMQRAREEVQALTNLPGWWELPAVRREQVFVADGTRYFHRPGPQVVESLEVIAEILHPEEFQFGHGGEAWQLL